MLNLRHALPLDSAQNHGRKSSVERFCIDSAWAKFTAGDKRAQHNAINQQLSAHESNFHKVVLALAVMTQAFKADADKGRFWHFAARRWVLTPRLKPLT